MANQLTPFQQQKILRVFNMLYESHTAEGPEYETKIPTLDVLGAMVFDTNGDGVIEKSDFTMLLDNISQILKWDKGSNKHDEAEKTLDIIWEELKTFADKDMNSKITKDEWLQMWAACLNDLEKHGQFPAWQEKYMKLMFDVNDKSGDNMIDEQEYETFFKHFDMTEDECKAAFCKISKGVKDNKISRSDFEKLWREYLTSNDVNSDGNFLFGPKLE